MRTNVKKNQHSLKIVRRFDEDIWGRLAFAIKPTRALNYVYDVYQNTYKYKRLLRKRFFSFISKKRSKFLYKVVTDEKEFKRKKRTLKINYYLTLLKLRRFYGNLGRNQFKRIFKQNSLTSNVLGRSFAYFLESRLDVILYRSNFFHSIYAARQFINHKKVYINGVLVTKPGYKLFINDIITLSLSSNYYSTLKKRLDERQILVNVPRYLEVDYQLGSIIFTRMPSNTEVPYPFLMNISNISHSFVR